MKRVLSLLTLAALIVAAVASFGTAQIPQYYSTISANDFTVLDDSTGDTSFVIDGVTSDEDTSITYTGFLWQGLTMECYSDAPHADSAGVTYYLDASVRGVTFTAIDSVNVTVDATPTFGTTDLRAGRYKFYRFRVNSIASTDSQLTTFVRVLRWGDR